MSPQTLSQPGGLLIVDSVAFASEKTAEIKHRGSYIFDKNHGISLKTAENIAEKVFTSAKTAEIKPRK